MSICLLIAVIGTDQSDLRLFLFVCVCVLVIDMNKYYKTRPSCAGLVDDGYFQNYSTGREM